MTHPPLLDVQALQAGYANQSGLFNPPAFQTVLQDLSFALHEREIIALVGASGCGKSTAAKAISQLLRPIAGRVFFAGKDLCQLHGKTLHQARSGMQMVFQNPMASLDPMMTVGNIILESMHQSDWSATEKYDRCQNILEKVGMEKDSIYRYPHEFSGGQRQRIALARALAPSPKLLICDEALSALDLSLQAQIVNLLLDMRDESGLAILFISHDLHMVNWMCDKTLVLHEGNVIDRLDRRAWPCRLHTQTRLLLKANPVLKN